MKKKKIIIIAIVVAIVAVLVALILLKKYPEQKQFCFLEDTIGSANKEAFCTEDFTE